MVVSEGVIAGVVKAVSEQPANPNFVQETVGAYMRRQPIVGNYVAAHQSELGVEGVVLVLLHAAILARAVESELGRNLPQLTAQQLNEVSSRAGDESGFGDEQPAIFDYLVANVADDATLKTAAQKARGLYLLRVAALAMVGAA